MHIHSATELGSGHMRLQAETVLRAVRTKATSKSLDPKGRAQKKSAGSGLSLGSNPGDFKQQSPCGSPNSRNSSQEEKK